MLSTRLAPPTSCHAQPLQPACQIQAAQPHLPTSRSIVLEPMTAKGPAPWRDPASSRASREKGECTPALCRTARTLCRNSCGGWGGVEEVGWGAGGVRWVGGWWGWGCGGRGGGSGAHRKAPATVSRAAAVSRTRCQGMAGKAWLACGPPSSRSQIAATLAGCERKWIGRGRSLSPSWSLVQERKRPLPHSTVPSVLRGEATMWGAHQQRDPSYLAVALSCSCSNRH